MTDPAVYRPTDSEPEYAPYQKGKDLDIFLKGPNGNESLGLVWPGLSLISVRTPKLTAFRCNRLS